MTSLPPSRLAVFGTLPRRVWIAVGLLALAIGLGVGLVLHFVALERERDLYHWQQRMALVAEARAVAVNDWLAQQFARLTALADNTALQLYVTQIATMGLDAGDAEREAPEIGYLRNLLIASADAGGFVDRRMASELPANVAAVGRAGLGLFSAEGRLLVATRGMPVEDALLGAALGATPRGERGLIDLNLSPDGEPRMGFVVPVFAVQSEHSPADQIAWVVGLKEVAAELYPLLVPPGVAEKTAEVTLVRGVGNVIEYLSPRRDGRVPLSGQMARETPGLDAAFALSTPGGFGIERDDHGVKVLAISRAIPTAGWTLLYTVSADEALAESKARAGRLLTVLLLAIGFVAAALVAVWHHAASRRSAEAAQRYQQLAEKLSAHDQLLRLVTDNQPNGMLIVDPDLRVGFANRSIAEELGIPAGDAVGKTLASLFGPAQAAPLEALCRACHARGGEASLEQRIDAPGEKPKIVRHLALPLPETAGEARTLLVKQDITAAVLEREKREHELEDLVGGLVGVVDRRDPFAAHHSRRTAEVAGAIAGELGLSDEETRTVTTAARLMNIGKILVPEELLAAGRALTVDELGRVRRSILAGAELLEGVALGGNVPETLRQLLEHWDGSGMPRGLKGDEIRLSSRIVAVANAFVGLVSARAYRDGLDFNQAIDALLREAGKNYDRSMVVALINYLDNKDGRRRWAHFQRAPERPDR